MAWRVFGACGRSGGVGGIAEIKKNLPRDSLGWVVGKLLILMDLVDFVDGRPDSVGAMACCLLHGTIGNLPALRLSAGSVFVSGRLGDGQRTTQQDSNHQ